MMKCKCSLYPEKILLMLSGCAFVALILPAWFSGFLWGGISCVILCAAVCLLPVTRPRLRQLMSNGGHFALGLLVTSALACNFYNTWLDSSYVLKIAGVLGVAVEPFLFGCGAVAALAAAPGAQCALSWFIRAAGEDYRLKQEDKAAGIPAGKAVLILFAVYAVGISAILRADFLYRDDFGRAAFGYKQWDYFSRYLSTAMATLVHMEDYLVDIAPLPQLLAMLIMAVSSVLTLYIVYDRKFFSVWELASVVPMGLNPYFLECVSYRFDAPYMAVSVLCGVLPLLYRSRNSIAYVFASMLGVLCVCTSYQAATGVFPMLVILLAVRMLQKGQSFRDTLVFCLKSVAGFGLGLVFFKLVIMKPADAGYVTNALPGIAELIPNTLENLGRYYRLIGSDFKPFWRVLTVLSALAFLHSGMMTGKKRPVTLLLSALGLVLMALLCFGIYPVLAETIFEPRAMYGFGVLVALLGITAAEGKRPVLGKLPVLVLAWTFFVFSFHYGNALSAQKAYTDFRINLVLEDVNDLEVFASGEPVTVQLTGTIGQAPVIRNTPQNYGMLNRLLPETFGGGADWTQYGFYYYYDLKHVVWDREADLTQLDLPLVKQHMYHDIHADDSHVLICLK